ncbi:MAG: EAL domain-containing protein [Planctomycetales bacterium]|nr:EAL domain-containing protein [Planctomycetales bacterium]
MRSEAGLALNASVWFFAGQIGESEPVRHVPIRAMPFTVGRSANLDLSLPCNSVSKEHALIYERDGQLFVRDLNSTNGTYLNGERVTDESLVSEGDILQFATVVFRVGRDEDEQVEGGTIQQDACDRALAMVQFDRLISERAVVPFYQPIVNIDDLSMMGYEVLGRSRLFGLKTPGEMFATASQLNLEGELSRIFRNRGLEEACKLAENTNLFVNTHPIELVEPGLDESLRAVRKLHPTRKITLEIHEAAVTSPTALQALRSVLTELDMELAFDDFGQGQARLIELSEASPDYLKFDMQLVQGIYNASPRRQQVLDMLVRMVIELGIAPLAEGVESQEDHETLQQMGFQLGQGYLYGHPAPIHDCKNP